MRLFFLFPNIKSLKRTWFQDLEQIPTPKKNANTQLLAIPGRIFRNALIMETKRWIKFEKRGLLRRWLTLKFIFAVVFFLWQQSWYFSISHLIFTLKLNHRFRCRPGIFQKCLKSVQLKRNTSISSTYFLLGEKRCFGKGVEKYWYKSLKIYANFQNWHVTN